MLPDLRELGMSLVPRIPGHDAALVRTALVDGFVVYCIGDRDARLDAIRALVAGLCFRNNARIALAGQHSHHLVDYPVLGVVTVTSCAGLMGPSC